MNETSLDRARGVTEFIGDLVDDAEIRMKMHGTEAAVLSYPRERIALLKVCREQIEAMLEWKRHERRFAALEDGIAAIAAIRATAGAAGDRISVVINQTIVRQLRDCMKYLVEYEVRKEQDSIYGRKGRR